MVYTRKFKDILMKMTMLERVIGQLYKTYARQFPKNAPFWIQLSQEEEEHARLINDLEEKLKQSTLSFDENRFKVSAIQTTIRYIQEKIRKGQNGLLTEQEAYHIAWDIENGLLEKNFFKTFTADQPDLKEVLNKLIRETEIHRDRIVQKKNQTT